jgi:hypothetical protein
MNFRNIKPFAVAAAVLVVVGLVLTVLGQGLTAVPVLLAALVVQGFED